MLAVAFPHDQVQILPYNRTVKDLGGLSPDDFLAAVRASVSSSSPGPPLRPGAARSRCTSRGRGTRCGRALPPMRRIRSARSTSACCRKRLLAPVLKIADVRTDKRIDFVGGARGTRALEQLVDSGKAAVAFSLFPVSVADLMAVSDAGEIMPPKSTWFEPKLRDGLLIHVI